MLDKTSADSLPPFVSVIVPTYRDWHRLQICLNALHHQSYPTDRYEIIIANNDPSNQPKGVATSPCLRIITAVTPGSYAARNRGIEIAKGDVYAFTDSDCTPDHDWISRGVSRLKQGYDRVAGKIIFTFKSDKLTPAEIYEKAFSFNQQLNASKGVSVTANMMAWSSCFSKVGTFNEQLLSGGDFEWGNRASDSGLTISYCENTVVYHPARATLSDLFKKKRRIHGGEVFLQSSDSWPLHISRTLRGLIPPVFAWSRIVARTDLTIREKAWCIALVAAIKAQKALDATAINLRLAHSQRE